MKYFIYCRKSSEAEDRQVLSIESQIAELQSKFAPDPEIEIVDVLEEAYSAKAPGRLVFDDMLKRIERGEANGIIAWHADRLARNSVDGGRIIYLLDNGKLKDLRFATSTFENNPQGKFMLSIIFGYNKYYVDNLSENVKRGNRTKIANGWRPNRAPIGYKNCLETKTIVPDPEHFPYVRRIFDLALSGTHSIGRIRGVATDQWGYRTPKLKRMGGTPIAHSTLHHMLTNPFYAGQILWGGQLYPGKHKPVVSLEEFDRVQELLGRPTRSRPKRHSFAYTGLIKCGACGLSITAEHKQNRHGSRYIYYHCTRRHRTTRCTEPSIEVKALERQIRAFLRRVYVPDPLHEWAADDIKTWCVDHAAEKALSRQSLERAITETEAQISNLTDLRIRAMITDEEYEQKRHALNQTLVRLQADQHTARHSADTFEPQELLLFFSNRAVNWFQNHDDEVRRRIVQTVSSNPTLNAKILNIQARQPFAHIAQMASLHFMLAEPDDVRTHAPPFQQANYEHLSPEQQRVTAMLLQVARTQHDPETRDMLDNIKWLIDRCEPRTRLAA